MEINPNPLTIPCTMIPIQVFFCFCTTQGRRNIRGNNKMIKPHPKLRWNTVQKKPLMNHAHFPWLISWRGKIYPRHMNSSPMIIEAKNGSQASSIHSSPLARPPKWRNGGDVSRPVSMSKPEAAKVKTNNPIVHNQSPLVMGLRRKRFFIAVQEMGLPSSR